MISTNKSLAREIRASIWENYNMSLEDFKNALDKGLIDPSIDQEATEILAWATLIPLVIYR
jgi:hypothetical protein